MTAGNSGSALSFEPIALSAESTVVAEFTPDPSKDAGFQSEADLERRLIELLQEQAYEYLPLHCEADLVANLRTQLEALNKVTFTDVAGVCLIHPACWQNRRNARRRSRFFVA